MERTIKLISVVAIVMGLTIAFSGVAVASPTVPPTKETETFSITTDATCSGTVVESQEISLEIDSVNLLDNPPLATGEIYGKIKYVEKMIGSSGTTDFDRCLWVPGTPGAEGQCTGPSCSELSEDGCTGPCTWEEGTPGTERHSTYPLGSRMTYYEKSTANGLWEFSKVIDYKSVISGSG